MAEVERIYYRDTDDGVLVTNSRVLLGGTTYSIRNLASVRVAEVKPDYLVPGVCIAIGLGVSAVAWLVSANVGGAPRGTPLMLIIVGLAMVIAGFVLCLKVRRRFAVRISSSSGEVNAFSHAQRDRIARIVDAITMAMTGGAAEHPSEAKHAPVKGAFPVITK